MKSKSIIFAAIFLASCSARSGGGHPEATGGSSQNTQPQPSQEQMQAYMKEASTPTENHAALKKLAGNWNVEAKFWMDPNGKPEVSKGKAVNKMILGDRFLFSSYKGAMMGQPFEGQGTIGYDTVTKKYFSTWIDSMNTGMFESRGSANADNSQITLNADFTCPMTRAPMKTEEVVTFDDKNRYTYESYELKDGKREKHMELTYSRAK